MLDTGLKTDESLLALEAALAGLNLDWRVIARILISHMHPDHVGAAAEIRRRSGAPIRMHPREAEMVKPRGPDHKFFERAEPYMHAHGVPQADIDAMREEASGVSERMERFVADESIAGGDTIEFAEARCAPSWRRGIRPRCCASTAPSSACCSPRTRFSSGRLPISAFTGFIKATLWASI